MSTNSQTNPLHSDLWPRIVKYEAEVVSMTAGMLGADNVPEASGDEVCGVVSSGGTESIMLAMKTYRDWARREKGITHPEMVVPVTAHAAFDKAVGIPSAAIHTHVDRLRRRNPQATPEQIARMEASVARNQGMH